MKLIISLLCLPFLLLGYCHARTVLQEGTFKNPILDESLVYPSVTKHEDSYYMVVGRGPTIEILKSPILSNFRDAVRQVIYQGPPGMNNIFSPKLQSIRGGLYIYYSMGPDSSLPRTRLYVIQNLDPSGSPLGEWSEATQLVPEEDMQAHKGTVFEYNNGDLYLIWTGHIADGAYFNLFIAKMENPMKAVGPRTLLRAPTREWEKGQIASDDSPSILQHNLSTFLVFTASYCLDADCCLGVMEIDGGRDPMKLSDWRDDIDRCVFAKSMDDAVYGPHHASFVKSPDNSETWMVYQASDDSWKKTMRIQKIEWEMNNPKFPLAKGFNTDLKVPRGEL